MSRLGRTWNSFYFWWVLLALPAVAMAVGIAAGGPTAGELIHPSGEFAARLIIAAMMISPLRMMFPRARWLSWILRRRRSLGVAAFGYVVLHTALYVVDMETLRDILAEFWALGIWTGWAAFLILIPLAGSSHDVLMRRLRQWWKFLHRWIYLAAMLTLVHWMIVDNNIGPALAHFVPLALLEIYRIVKTAMPERAPAHT